MLYMNKRICQKKKKILETNQPINTISYGKYSYFYSYLFCRHTDTKTVIKIIFYCSVSYANDEK